MDVQKTIEEINASINGVADPVARAIISQLLNIIEYQAREIKVLKEENQKLRDENNRLKGEQGKPNIRLQHKKDISSENERKQHNKNNKLKRSKAKNHKIKINRTVRCKINPKQLPEDAVFKGYRTVIVQDISIKTNNVKFKKEVYYSPSCNKTFIASVPDGYEGEFGPHIKSLIITQHFKYKMTEPAIVEFLRDHSIQISAATVSRIITDHNEQFHKEKKDIVQAGLPSSVYQQMDDTRAKVNGKNYYTHVLCNQYYTAYFTRPSKNKLTVLEILAQKELSFEFNESAYALMSQMGLSNEVLAKLKNQLKGEQSKQVSSSKLMADTSKATWILLPIGIFKGLSTIGFRDRFQKPKKYIIFGMLGTVLGTVRVFISAIAPNTYTLCTGSTRYFQEFQPPPNPLFYYAEKRTRTQIH